MNSFLGLFNYGAALFLVLFGLYVMMVENNFVRKVIGMVILQTGSILFYISIAFKTNASLPIINAHDTHHAIDPTLYANPLPHALMLTAIVVGVATLGVSLVLLVSIYRSHNTLEENEVLDNLKNSTS